MGFNTVAMLLNDQMHMIQRAPHGLAHLLCHPPGNGEASGYIRQHAYEISKEHGENWGGLVQVEVMPTFHASNTMFYKAGQNSIEQLQVLKYHTVRGKKCVTLILE